MRIVSCTTQPPVPRTPAPARYASSAQIHLTICRPVRAALRVYACTLLDPRAGCPHPGPQGVPPHCEPTPNDRHALCAPAGGSIARHAAPGPDPSALIVDVPCRVDVLCGVVPHRLVRAPAGPLPAHARGRRCRRPAGRRTGARSGEGTGDPGCPWGLRVPGGRGFGLADHEPVEGWEGPRNATAALRAVPTRRRTHEQGLARPRTGASPLPSVSFGKGVFVWRRRNGCSRYVFGGG